MTTISQIITDAYQYNNIVSLYSIPSAAEEAKALRYLNRIFRSIFGNELGDQLTVWNVGKNNVTQTGYCFDEDLLTSPYNIPHNSRLVFNLQSSTTVYLPRTPQDGERLAVQDLSNNFATSPLTINGNGRLIEGATSLVLNTNSANSEWFFRSDLGNWVKITDLALADIFPLPAEFEEYFITMLAIRLGSSEDVDINNQLAIVMKDASKKIRSRYKQITEVGSELGLIKLTGTGLNRYNSIRFENG
jgi:hypothetical protein